MSTYHDPEVALLTTLGYIIATDWATKEFTNSNYMQMVIIFPALGLADLVIC